MTPKIIKPMPKTAGVSSISLYNIAPNIAMSTIPTPDQIAYVMPTGIDFIASVMK